MRADRLLPELEMLKRDSWIVVERNGKHPFHGGRGRYASIT